MKERNVKFTRLAFGIIFLGLVFVSGYIFHSSSAQNSPNTKPREVWQNVESIQVSILTDYSGDPHPKWITTADELGLVQLPNSETNAEEARKTPIFLLHLLNATGDILVWMLVDDTGMTFSTGDGTWHYVEDNSGLSTALKLQARERGYQELISGF